MSLWDVRVMRTKAARAVCQDCDRLNAGSSRLRVRQHVLAYAHTAHYIVEDATYYRPPVKP